MKKRAIVFRRKFFEKAHFPMKNRNRAALTSKKYDNRPCMKNELGFKKRSLAARSTFRNKISVQENIIPLHKRMIAVPAEI